MEYRTNSGPTQGLKIDIYSEGSGLQTMFIPAGQDGFFQFPDTAENAAYMNIGFEANQDHWRILCLNEAAFADNSGKEQWRLISDQSKFLIRSDNQLVYVYIRFMNRENSAYLKFVPNQRSSIIIGRDFQCDLQLVTPRASRQHARLSYDGKRFTIEDLKSTNGLFVNGIKVAMKKLKAGDLIYIGGVDLVVGIGFISVNLGKIEAPDALINNHSLVPFNPNRSPYLSRPGGIQEKPEIYLNRFPRRRKALKEKTITIDQPPYSMDSKKMPMMLRMGSSLVMGGSAALMGSYTMLLTSVLFPFLTSKYTDKEKKEYEEKRVSKYSYYLMNKKKEIGNELLLEEQILNQNYPVFEEVLKYTEKRQLLWTHKQADDDFLTLRIGNGTVPMKAEINGPKENFSLDEDALTAKMLEVTSGTYDVKHAPILVDLLKYNVTSVLGAPEQTEKMMHLLIGRSALLFSYDELKMVFLFKKETLSRFSYVRYLPHVWNEDFSSRMIAADSNEAYQISKVLNPIIEERLKQEQWMKHSNKKQHYLIFTDNKKIFDEIEGLKTAMAADHPLGLSVVCFFDEMPKDTSLQMQLGPDGKGTITYISELDKEEDAFTMDVYSKRELLAAMQKLSSFRLGAIAQKNALPSSLDFLSMFNTKTIETLNPLKRWKESNPISSLAAPIGVNVDGSLFELDLHQKYQGPHGLVAGTTGSGKSEFLITYILSMALNYHPQEVSFVLIDYKGGGLAGAFSNPDQGIHLPHLVGTITNLDGATINRSIISIESELKRRQIIFNDAKKALNEGTMDIHLYQKLYRAGKVSEPVSHLFIISDEFAELKQQEPEFMDKLISTARIGRSLGVHLILATQKPSGVVNDQIVSNTKFRVCLKVQDAADSNDMLKRPDAAELKEAGRFYLQVGYNEFFALGQSAWTGADYSPNEVVLDPEETEVRFIDNSGTVIHTGKKKQKRASSGQSQLTAIVQYLSSAAKRHNIEPKPLWQEPLPLKLDALTDGEKYLQQTNSLQPDPDRYSTRISSSLQKMNKADDEMKIFAGLVDDPAHQKQYPYILDLLKLQNVLIAGEMGSGKSSILQTILYNACRQFSPEDVNIYGIDFAGSSLNMFKTLPHAGSILAEDETEKLSAFFDLVDGIVEQRKRLMRQMGAEDFISARKAKKMPLILIAIDNYAAMSSSKDGERLVLNFHEYLKNAYKYGICYLITIGRSAEISMKVKAEIFERICLSQKENYEYNEILSVRANGSIVHTAGRGYCVHEKTALECQFARIDPQTEGLERSALLKRRIEEAGFRWPGKFNPVKIPEIPTDQEYKEFAELFDEGKLPLGYHLDTSKPIAIPYKQFSMMTLYFGGELARERILSNFLYSLSGQKGKITLFKRSGESPAARMLEDLTGEFEVINSEEKAIDDFWLKFQNVLFERKDHHDLYCEQQGMDGYDADSDKSFAYMRKTTKPLILFFEDFAEFCNAASEEARSVFPAIFNGAKWWNIYLVGCLYPETISKGMFTQIFKEFNPEKLVLLFGGEFSKQNLIASNKEAASFEKDKIPNLCFMEYRKKRYFLAMPCGSFEQEVLDEDDLPIFG